MKEPRKVGFWKGEGWENLVYPDVRDHVDADWDPAERERVLAYLRAGVEGQPYTGYSRCRICGSMNGNTERTDGTYLWPSGFAHYLVQHGVKPPDGFLAHVAFKLAPKKAARHPGHVGGGGSGVLHWHERRAVCKRCNAVMRDGEAFAPKPYFYHPSNGCTNSGKVYYAVPLSECVPYERKRVRRARRRGARAAARSR